MAKPATPGANRRYRHHRHGPLLVIGKSVVLALFSHYGADALINTALIPVTGKPMFAVLGVPILFGVLQRAVLAG